MDKKLVRLKERQNEIFSVFAETIGGISSPIRVRLIHFLSQGPLTVETLANKIEQSVANTSMHLRKMLSLKIVTVEVRGKNRVYSLHPSAFNFWEHCQNFLQQIDPSLELNEGDVTDDLDWPEDLRVTLKKARENDVVLIDARPTNEVTESLEELNVLHIPSSDINKNLSKISKRKPVLVFCRGRFCALSTHTVRELRKNGIRAYRLNESWYSIKNRGAK
ncbi:MAG: ArsR family transcriptional regulator [Bdellovibrionales bacterium]|nr:ArsR family transcriptional regulator [Bdellovibrionales bacterium]